MPTLPFRPISSAVLMAVFLAGCGGGGGSDPSETEGPTAGGPPLSLEAAAGANPVDGPNDDTPTFREDGQETIATASVSSGTTAPTTEPTEQPQAVLVADGNIDVNYTFDAFFKTFAPGWWLNYWGDGKPKYAATRETDSEYVLSGTASQRFRLDSVPANGGAHLVYTYGFVNGQKYRAAINLRADRPTVVDVQLRRDRHPWNRFARRRLTIGTTWQRVELSGTYSWTDVGSLRIVPVTLGSNIFIDDMSIVNDIDTPEPTPIVEPEPTPIVEPEPTPIVEPEPTPIVEPETTPIVEPETTPTPEPELAYLPNAIDLPVAGGSSVETKTLKVMSMDDAFTRFARGWTFNSWGGTSSPQFAASQDTRPGYLYSGTGSQKFEIINKNGGEVQLVHAHNFVKGKTYRATLKIRSEESTSVKVFMRRDEHPWDAFASRTLTVGSAWQTVEIEGAYIGDVVGSLRVAINAPAGTVWVDEVTLAEVARNDMAPVSTEPIPDTLFGMHVNKLGVHNQWPGLGTRIVRLWNTGTDWSDLEPANNAWDFSRGSGLRLDMYVNYILSNEPEASILYTLGVTPKWASASPNSSGFRGPGSNSAPKEMADWRDYVRTLATRYAGKIRYWELWNEPDYAPHWVGGYANLVEMARIAREELLAADPNNKLVGPGFSAGQGMRGLEEFLVAGGGAYVDMIGFHWYYSTNPESLAPMIDNVRALMRAYGVDDKPLWNTEGAFICNSAAMDCKTFKPTLAQLQSVNARAMFIMAARGVANFNYHNWESAPWGFGHLVESDFITPTPAAGPFAEARTWARGAKIVDAFRINDLIYAFKLERNGEIAYVLWATRPDTAINVPSAWDVNRVRVVTGNDAALPTTRQLVLGLEPVLLRR